MQVHWSQNEEDDLVGEGYVSRRYHPEFPLYILNYTPLTTFKRYWNEITLECRGLIVNTLTREIVSRPFPKFFNLEEVKEIPNGSFRTYDKLDGSLGISYHYDGKTYISTRGSFESPQAARGTELLRSQFCCTPLDPGLTYLFEVICKESQYVVDYKGFEGLVLLAVIETETGEDLDISQFKEFVKAEQYRLNTLTEVVKFVKDRPNSEGVVLHFSDDTRIKVKSAEYLRKFAVIVGLTSKWVWEQLATGQDLNDVIGDDTLPEERRAWLEEEVNRLNKEFQLIYDQCIIDLSATPQGSRKESASYITNCRYPHVVFAMLDGRESAARQMVWNLLKPKGEK